MITDPTLESQEAMTAKTLSVPPVERSGGSDTPYPAIANIPQIYIERTDEASAEAFPEAGNTVTYTDEITATMVFSENYDRLSLRVAEDHNNVTPAFISSKVVFLDGENHYSTTYVSGLVPLFRTPTGVSGTYLCADGSAIWKVNVNGTYSDGGNIIVTQLRLSLLYV